MTHKNRDLVAAEVARRRQVKPLLLQPPPTHSLTLEQVVKGRVVTGCSGGGAIDASGQSVTAEHRGLHSQLSHPVSLSRDVFEIL